MRVGVWFLVCASFVSVTRGQDPLVLIKQGLVRGSRASDGDYSEFLGIPFATVDPENPFGDSLPFSKFDGVLDAHEDGPSCPQISMGGIIEGSLDCLTVNLYVPASASSKNKVPVMVWIYGGGFEMGSASKSSFGPQYLVRHEVILVTLNYRLGPYGFMCLDIPSVPGNAGLKDQQAALRWIHENIEAFGGDSNSITLFGQSAGAGSIEYHILNHDSTGLFNKAILQSASVFIDGILEDRNPTLPLEIANHLGYHSECIQDALEFLKNVTTLELLKISNELGINYKPCVEKTFTGVDGFLTTSPQKLLEAGEYTSVPMMMGHTSSESKMRIDEEFDETDFVNKYQNIIFDKLNLRFNFDDSLQLEIAERIVKDFYIGHRDISLSDESAITDFDSDFTYNYGIERSLVYHLRQSNYPIYQYVFGYMGSQIKKRAIHPNSIMRLDNSSGVGHGGDIRYIFKNSDSEVSDDDQLVIDRMTSMWTNFAKYGDPTPEVSELLPVRWPTVSKDSRDYLLIDSQLRVEQRPFHERMAFWDLFFVAYGEYFWLA